MPEPKRSQYEAMQMARKIKSIYPEAPMSRMPQALKRRDTWADTLAFYGATGKRSGFCDEDAAAAEAWDWVIGEESPLDGYASAYTGPEQTGGQP